MKAKPATFSKVVCAAPTVRGAFAASSLPACIWWNCILFLHGKPIPLDLTPNERTGYVVAGFRFYAVLYRFVAALFFALSPLLFAFDAAQNRTASAYWAIGAALAAVYLWGAGGLGLHGAYYYRRKEGAKATAALVTFMVMIVAFLSMFIAVVSVVLHRQGGDALFGVAVNIAATVALFVFGVGSYLIEIIFLATERLPAE